MTLSVFNHFRPTSTSQSWRSNRLDLPCVFKNFVSHSQSVSALTCTRTALPKSQGGVPWRETGQLRIISWGHYFRLLRQSEFFIYQMNEWSGPVPIKKCFQPQCTLDWALSVCSKLALGSKQRIGLCKVNWSWKCWCLGQKLIVGRRFVDLVHCRRPKKCPPPPPWRIVDTN